MLAPTLVTACTALPPEGAGLAWGGPALAGVAPTLVTALTSPNGWLRQRAAADADWQAFTRYLQ